MSCNIRIPLQQIIDDVAAALSDGFIKTDNAVLNEAVLNEVTIRGDISVDTAARNALCEILQTCGITAIELEWLDRPTVADMVAVSEVVAGEVVVSWKDLDTLITEGIVGKVQTTDVVDSLGVSQEEINTDIRNELDAIPFDGSSIADTFVAVTANNGTSTRTLREKLREQVSIMDFLTAEEIIAYRASPTTYDASRPLQEFFDYISANNVGSANANGDFRTRKTISLIGECQTMVITGHLRLLPLTGFVGECVFFWATGTEVSWFGKLDLFRGTYTWSNREVEIGFKAGSAPNGAAAPRTYIDEIFAGGYKQIGVYLGQASTGMTIRKVAVHGNGSGVQEYPQYSSPIFTSYLRSDYHVNGSQQYTEVKVDRLPPDNLVTQLYVRFTNGTKYDLHEVVSVDRVNNTMRVYPCIDYALVGNIESNYVYGGGIYTAGGDSSLLNLPNIYASINSFAVWLASLYPANVGSVVSEGNLATLVVGAERNKTTMGGCVAYLYTEANYFDFVKATSNMHWFRILTDAGLSIPKTLNMNAYRVNSAIGNSLEGNDLTQLITTSLGYECKFEGEVYVSPQEFEITSLNRNTRTQSWYAISDLIIPITINEDTLGKLGYHTRKIRVVVNNSVTNSTTAKLTFTAPTGYTFNNGTTSYVKDGMLGVCEFTFFIGDGNKIHVSVDEHVTETATVKPSATLVYDPPNLLAGEQASIAVDIPNAYIGDTLVSSFSSPLSGVQMWASMSSAQIATVYFKNGTSEPVDIPSGTITVKVV